MSARRTTDGSTGVVMNFAWMTMPHPAGQDKPVRTRPSSPSPIGAAGHAPLEPRPTMIYDFNWIARLDRPVGGRFRYSGLQAKP